jgi:deoxyribodipyrimidine photo-lyase
MSDNMRRDFNNRDDLIAYLKGEFPKAYARDSHVSETRGGRKAAEEHLKEIEPGRKYAKTRNYLNGAVSHLSPYIRYGVLNVAEVRDFAIEKEGSSNAYKFINELGWHDYYQRRYAEIGDAVWRDLEDWKTGYQAAEYADDLPEDIEQGETGVKLIDDIVQQLKETGYLHNRQRMYFAAYVCHWRNVKWQAGARFFLTHLLDGDPASNNLSWQWVSSTGSHKPYIFNLSNVRKYTGNQYDAPAEEIGMEEFDASYDRLNRELFHDGK